MSDTPRTDADFARELQRENARLLVETARLQMELDASCNAEELRQVRAENALLRRVAQLAADAVESGAIDECYLSLLRDAFERMKESK